MITQLEQQIIMPLYKQNLEVVIKQDSKEGIGLIDHDYSDTFQVWKFRVSQSIIYRDSIILSKAKDHQFQETNNITAHKNQLVQVNKIKNQYTLTIKNNQPTFLIVKDIKGSHMGEYPLLINSIIRLGRVEYHVIEERTSQMQTQYAPALTKTITVEDNDQVYQCRFCFMEGKQSLDQLYLTDICRCQGNSKAVHLECLKFWIDQNIQKEETQFGLCLKWTKAFECQVCKDILPTRISYQDKYVDLFSLERPDMKYILLQNINRDKNICTEMYLIHELMQDSIKIGRAFTCDIKAQDITVSRHHSSIKFIDSCFVICDNKSKFGTLLSINGEMTNLDCVSYALQQGKLIIQVTQIDPVHKSSPATQHKLTQLPQISKQQDEDEPQMDDDSFQMENN